jgi:hypothetical protein
MMKLYRCVFDNITLFVKWKKSHIGIKCEVVQEVVICISPIFRKNEHEKILVSYHML